MGPSVYTTYLTPPEFPRSAFDNTWPSLLVIMEHGFELVGYFPARFPEDGLSFARASVTAKVNHRAPAFTVFAIVDRSFTLPASASHRFASFVLSGTRPERQVRQWFSQLTCPIHSS